MTTAAATAAATTPATTDPATELAASLAQARTDAPTTEAALESAIAIYKHAKSEIDRYKEIQAQARGLIGEIFAETGQEKATTAAGKAYVTSPSISVRYDTKALDALAASDDGIARLLTPHRSESQRAGTLTIR